MATTVTITSAESTRGKVFVRFGKVEREFNSLDDMRRWAQETVARRLDVDLAHALAILDEARKEQPDLRELVGREVSIDDTAETPIDVKPRETKPVDGGVR